MPVKLSALISILKDKEVLGDTNLFVDSVSFDSRKTEHASLFACLKGQNRDGHDFAKEAVNNGAVALLVDHFISGDGLDDIIQVRVSDTRAALALVSSAFYGHPSKSIRLIGVTGTNGKTTTTHLIRSILLSAGYSVGLIGTVCNVVGGLKEPVVHTTPEAPEIQALLQRMKRSGDAYAVMEVSSHGIDQKRVAGCEFDVLVFTNLTQDHLDYHETMENYFNAKASVFRSLGESYWGAPKDSDRKLAVLNSDDDWARRIAGEFAGRDRPEVVTFGIESAEADVCARDIVVSAPRSSFNVVTNLQGVRDHQAMSLPLLGRFNVYNALAAIAVAANEGIPLSKIAAALKDIPQVPGRMESIQEGQDYSVFVDYAHTPDGLEKAISTVREVTTGKVITVFGCGGDRDKKKRPIMGQIAAALSDYAVLTSDNPRTEDPVSISKDVETGILDSTVAGGAAPHGKYSVILDRREAISTAVDAAVPGDSVLVAGKGHETYQILNLGKVAFDDRMVLREAIMSEGFTRGKRSFGPEADWAAGILTVKEILSAVDGRLLSGDANTRINGVCIDSRATLPGDLFIALPGEKTDGHLFVKDSFRAGAGAALVSRMADTDLGRDTVIQVPNTLEGLLRLAAYAKRQYPSVRTIGITGSVGKTTTKEFTASILSRRYLATWNRENLNTEIGLSLAVFGLRPWHEVFVAEMGMRGPGEISQLARMTEPSIGVITNIGPIHLERLGSMEAIAKAKAEILDALPVGGFEILNRDDPNSVNFFAGKSRPGVHRTWFGESAESLVRAVNVRPNNDGCYSFDLRVYDEPGGICVKGKDDVRVPIPGRHNVLNALAACSVALAMGISPEDCKLGIETVPRIKLRLQIEVKKGIVFVCDYYNAGPASVAGAFEVLMARKGQKKIAILGDMLELGSYEEEAHLDIGRLAARCDIDHVFTLGSRARLIGKGALGEGFPAGRWHHSESPESIANDLLKVLCPGDVVLIKGSRAMHMEDVYSSIVKLLEQ